ncbi:MAG: ABC transporter permease subunit [Kofleriaceae bacterium]
MEKRVPSIGESLSALARVTFTRLFRGKLMWFALAIAFLPLFLSVAGQTRVEVVFGIEMFVLAILPPLFAAPAIAEELEDKTATYLWSRPIARWAILAGKLLALVPFVMALVTAGWVVGVLVATKAPPPPMTIVAVLAGAFGTSIVASGIAMLAPKRGMAFAIVYILIVDITLGSLPGSIEWLSVTHATRVLAGFEADTSPVAGVIGLLTLSAVWLAVAFRRIGRLET